MIDDSRIVIDPSAMAEQQLLEEMRRMSATLTDLDLRLEASETERRTLEDRVAANEMASGAGSGSASGAQ